MNAKCMFCGKDCLNENTAFRCVICDRPICEQCMPVDIEQGLDACPDCINYSNADSDVLSDDVG